MTIGIRSIAAQFRGVYDMRRLLTSVLATLTLIATIFVAPSAQAGTLTLIAYEGFDYTVGQSLEGQNGGTGWQGAWFKESGPNPLTIASPGLQYTGLATSGEAASYTTSSSLVQGDGRRLSQRISSGVVYIRFLVEFPGTSGAGSGAPSLRLFDAPGWRAWIGATGSTASGTGGSKNAGILFGGQWYSSNVNIYNGQPRLLLTRIDYDSQRMDLWVDPDLSTFNYSQPPTSQASAPGAPAFDRIDIFSLANQTFDEISILRWEPTAPPPPVQIITLDIDANGGSCSTSKITGEAGTWANLPGEEACTREGYEFLGFDTSAASTTAQFPPGAPVQLTGDNRVYAIYKEIVPEPFMCSANLYQVSGTGGGVLYVYDPTRNTMDLVPDGGGPDKAPGSNATGYNPADDFIYGIAPNGADQHLWKFGSNGVYADLGPIIDTATGAAVQNLSFISGDFVADDVLLAVQIPNRMLAVDVAPTRSEQSAQATLQTLPTGVWSAADIAFNADRTAGYGMSNNVLFIANLPGGDASAQIAAIGQRSTYSRKTVLGVPARATYGASYLDQSNNAYFYNNEERRIYLITAAELAKPQPTAVPLGTEKAFVLGTDQTLQIPTDGASCPTAPIVTVTLTYDIKGGEGETPSDQTGFVDQDVTVADGTGFEKDNAVFAGWNTAPDGSGANYTPGALFDLGASGGKLYAMWKPVEKAPPVPPENILDPVTEPEPPVDEGDEVVFTPLDELPAPPGDPWKPSSLVLIDPDGENPTPVVRDDSGDWSVNNRIGTVTYTPNPEFSGTAQITVQLQTESGVRYQSTLKTSVPSCEVGERVRATVYFDVLSSELDAQSRRTLNRLVRDANSRGLPTCSVVVGYVQPTVNRSNDISLSTSRATSVADYLDDRGITRIIRTEGLGRADQQGAKARRATATIYITPSPPATPVDQ